MFNGIFYGVIEEVFSPNHPFNKSKSQYEYKVIITHEGYAQIPSHCVRQDSYGSYHNFEDAIFGVGYRVLVVFPKGEGTIGVITGGIRSTSTMPIKPDEGYFYRHRFNEIETFINRLGTWQVKSDDGPSATLTKDRIIFDDSKGERITLDKVTKTLTIECKDLNIIVKGNATVTVEQDATMTVNQNATLTVAKNASVKAENITATASKNITVTASENARITAKNVDVIANGNAKIKAKKIELNGGQGAILTDTLNPVVDYITGIPSIGVTTVRSGQ